MSREHLSGRFTPTTRTRVERRCRTALTLAVLAITSIIGIEVVHALQPGPESVHRRFNNMNRVTVERVDVNNIIDTVLGGDDDPLAELVNELHIGYTLAWRKQSSAARMDVKRTRDEFRQQGSTDYQALQQLVNQRVAEWALEAHSLETSFFGDVKSLLSEDQMSNWPRFERDRRRRLTLRPRSRLAGEGIDLFAVVEALDLPQEVSEPLDEVLEEYAWDLDSALTAREEVADEVDAQMQSGNPNLDMEALYTMILPRREALRDINVNYIERLAGELPVEWAQSLRYEFNRLRFPRVYAETEADEYFEIVRELSDLSDSQQESIDAIESSYQTALADLNAQLIKYHLKREEDIPQRFRNRQRQREGAGDGSTTGDDGSGGSLLVAQTSNQSLTMSEDENLLAERAIWVKRRELSRETIERTHEVLTPEQREQAPMDDVIPGLGRGVPTVPHEGIGDQSSRNG